MISSSLNRKGGGPFALAGQESPNNEFSNKDEEEQLNGDGADTLAARAASHEPNQLRHSQPNKEATAVTAVLPTTAMPPPRNPSVATTTPPNRCSKRKMLVGGLMLLIATALVAIVVIAVNWSTTIDAPLFITLAPSTSPSLSPSMSPMPSSSPSISFKTNVMELIQSRSPESNFSSSSVAAALDWIVNDPYSVGLKGNDDRLVQRFALAVVWFSFDLEASSGRKFEGWMQPTDECTWRGEGLSTTPFCYSANAFVISLDLEGGDGAGPIPSEILLLSHLSFLRFATDSMTGTIPSQLSLLTSLTGLHFGSAGNLLTGTIPPELFSSLTNLERFQVGPNPEMSPSAIPSHISSLSKLSSLVLYGVPLSGSIPAELFLIPSLRTLSLGSSSGLTGSIPSTIGMLSRLSHLSVDGAKLTGTIPTEIGRLDSLHMLSLGHNSFSGTIPTEVGLLTHLTWLYAQSSGVQGTIPTEIGQLDSMIDLTLGSNPLNGTIPTEFARLTKLTYLELDQCSLTGTIPVEFSLLNSLEGLDISFNNGLVGTLMTEIGLLPELTYLQLGWNSLTGTLPTEIGLLTSLETLALNNNRLSGSLPSELANLTLLDDGPYLEANDLTGSIPISMCAFTTSQNIHVDLEKVECSCCACC